MAKAGRWLQGTMGSMKRMGKSRGDRRASAHWRLQEAMREALERERRRQEGRSVAADSVEWWRRDAEHGGKLVAHPREPGFKKCRPYPYASPASTSQTSTPHRREPYLKSSPHTHTPTTPHHRSPVPQSPVPKYYTPPTPTSQVHAPRTSAPRTPASRAPAPRAPAPRTSKPYRPTPTHRTPGPHSARPPPQRPPASPSEQHSCPSWNHDSVLPPYPGLLLPLGMLLLALLLSNVAFQVTFFLGT